MNSLYQLSDEAFEKLLNTLAPSKKNIAIKQREFELLVVREKGYKLGKNYNYSNMRSKVELFCPKSEHGGFYITPTKVIHRNQGCKECGKIKNHKQIRFSESHALNLVKAVYKAKNYDYSQFHYTNARTSFTVICPLHGEFKKTLYQVTNRGEGCRSCGITKAANERRIPDDEYILRAKAIHAEKEYQYIGIDRNKKVPRIHYICPVHGDIFQNIKSHMIGAGCDKCADIIRSEKRALTNEEFVSYANRVHGEYDYTKTKYKTSTKKVTVTCLKHGDFNVTGGNHLSGKGCPNCKLSKGETRIRNCLINLRLNFEQQYIFDDCKNVAVLPFDFMVSEKGQFLLIEYHGIQHYESIDFFGGEKALKSNKLRDSIKENYCDINNHKLLVIPYWEFDNIERIIESNIYN